jgi:hypothetical protein
MELHGLSALPHASLPPAVRPAGHTPADAAAVAPTASPSGAPSPVIPRRVELTFHEDLRVLMTKVIDAQTGDLVREYPARQVLDVVADVMARMRAREES